MQNLTEWRWKFRARPGNDIENPIKWTVTFFTYSPPVPHLVQKYSLIDPLWVNVIINKTYLLKCFVHSFAVLRCHHVSAAVSPTFANKRSAIETYVGVFLNKTIHINTIFIPHFPHCSPDFKGLKTHILTHSLANTHQINLIQQIQHPMLKELFFLFWLFIIVHWEN